MPVEVNGNNGGGAKKKKRNQGGNRVLILYSSVLGDLIPCVKRHPVLPTAQGVVGPAISTDAALFELRIVRHLSGTFLRQNERG